jgi:hypothetical protein
MKSIDSIVGSSVIAGIFVLAVEFGVAADVWPAFDVTGLDTYDELLFAGLCDVSLTLEEIYLGLKGELALK